MQPYLLALDLDGTTCDDTGRLSARTKSVLTAARAAGHIVCFATGRRDIDMLPFCDDVSYADYLVMNNGGKLVCTAGNAVLHNTFVDAHTVHQLVEHCLAHGYLLHIISGLYWGVNCLSAGVVAYAQALGVTPTLYKQVEQIPCARVEGFMATTDLAPIGSFIDGAGLPLTHVLSEPGCEDIMPQGVTKWEGILRLLQKLRIAPQRVIAAGDYDNDIPMLRGAGIGVAVQNALPHVKEVANYVSPYSNAQDAVADFIERYLLAQTMSVSTSKLP